MLNVFSRLWRRLCHCRQRRTLAAFDFDLTIIARDSDMEVAQMLPPAQLNTELLSVATNIGWLEFINKVLQLLHTQHGINATKIGDCVSRVDAVPGILRFLRKLSAQPALDMCILSDSNQYFISQWLLAHGVADLFQGVYSNPATVTEDGRLLLLPYEQQTDCERCPNNLCKGSVLKQLCQRKSYTRIFYAGDGCNDLCPILQLRRNDVACIRRGLELHGKFYAYRQDIQATVLHWSNGHDLCERLFPNNASQVNWQQLEKD